MSTLTAASEELLADLRKRWPEPGRSKMRRTIADALPDIEAAVRAECAAERAALAAAVVALVDAIYRPTSPDTLDRNTAAWLVVFGAVSDHADTIAAARLIAGEGT